MLALYFLGAVGLYLGIGHKAAKIAIKDAADEEYCKERITKEAFAALYMWPLWLFMDAPRIHFKKQINRAMLEVTNVKEQEVEVQKLLESGEIDV